LIANKYCSRRGLDDYLSVVRTNPAKPTNESSTGHQHRRTHMFKTLIIAVALIASSAAAVPAMAFVNLYATNADARSH